MANSWNRISIGLPCACGRGYGFGKVFLNASRAAKSAFGCFGRGTRRRRRPELLADAALVHRHAEPGLDASLEIDPPPAHHPVALGIGTGLHTCRELGLLLGGQAAGPAPGRRPVRQARQPRRPPSPLAPRPPPQNPDRPTRRRAGASSLCASAMHSQSASAPPVRRAWCTARARRPERFPPHGHLLGVGRTGRSEIAGAGQASRTCTLETA
jgi:hypothetical protein